MLTFPLLIMGEVEASRPTSPSSREDVILIPWAVAAVPTTLGCRWSRRCRLILKTIFSRPTSRFLLGKHLPYLPLTTQHRPHLPAPASALPALESTGHLECLLPVSCAFPLLPRPQSHEDRSLAGRLPTPGGTMQSSSGTSHMTLLHRS